jgi:hypothetical protein
MTTWRKYFAPIISKIIDENKDKSEKEIKEAFKNSKHVPDYNWPYKIWRNEILRQLYVRLKIGKPPYKKAKNKSEEKTLTLEL